MFYEDTAKILADGFPDWVHQQPKNKRYHYESYSDCAVGQYLAAMGYLPSPTNELSERVYALTHMSYNFVLSCCTTFGLLSRAMTAFGYAPPPSQKNYHASEMRVNPGELVEA